MMKRLLPLLALLPFSLAAQDTQSLTDFYSGKMLYYEDHYKPIKGNPFNLFDEIDASYPLLKDYPAASAKLYYYSVPYLESDSFKLELLQRAKIASALYVANYSERSLYEYNNSGNFLPRLKDSEYSFAFLFDGLLAVNLKYSYQLDFPGDDDPNFELVKSIYIRLSDGKVFRPEDLLLPQKQHALKSEIEEQLNTYYKANKENIVKEMTDDDGESDSDDEEGGDAGSLNKGPAPGEISLNELNIDISPLDVTLNIGEYSANSIRLRGMPYSIRYERDRFKLFIDPNGPLAKLITYNKTFVTSLHNVNMYNEVHYRSWQSGFNIQQDNDYTKPAPAKGVKAVSYYIRYKNTPDSLRELQRRKIYDASGKLTDIEYYEGRPSKLRSKMHFEYNTAGLLVRTTMINSRSDKKEGSKTFSYDSNNNLVSYTETDDDDGGSSASYHYDGLKVFETAHNDGETSKRTYELNSYGHIVSSANFGEQPQWKRYFDGDRELGSNNLKHPSMDNSLLCYNSKGQLLTVQMDNGRHLYEITYNAQGQPEQMVYFDSRQLKNLWIYEYNDRGLLSKETYYNNMSGFNRSDNTYYYSLEYEFY